jgi:diguanylate cyclase (GGDEF)-like protein
MNALGSGGAKRHHSVVPALPATVHYAFQPLINLRTGGIIAVEALARPASGSIWDVLGQAARAGRLVEADVELAVHAALAAAEYETLLPLHINVLAETVAQRNDPLGPLYQQLRRTGRRTREVVFEVGAPFSHINVQHLLAGMRRLRDAGYVPALAGVGDGAPPLTMLAEAEADLVKLDHTVVAGLPDDPRRTALVEALAHFCNRTGAALVAEGVETEAQLTALRKAGIHLAQGNLLATASRRPAARVALPPTVAEIAEPSAALLNARLAGPRVTDFLHPATMLAATATADEVRSVLANEPTVSGVVLVDDAGRPECTVDRNRFLLAVTGPYGHALHARRQAARLADPPRVVATGATAMELLDMLARGARDRINDDVVVIDEVGRCLGVVRVADVVRGVAEMKVEQAAALNPLTRLHGTDAVAQEVDRRIAAGEIFSVGWLDIDAFKFVNDTAGFAAGDDLIRMVGRGLTDAAARLKSVHLGHVGGDDFLIVASIEDIIPMAAVLDIERFVDGQPITLSLATLVCAAGTVADYRQASRLLAPIKHRAKALQGSSWVMGRPGSDHIDVLRGSPSPANNKRPAAREPRTSREPPANREPPAPAGEPRMLSAG